MTWLPIMPIIGRFRGRSGIDPSPSASISGALSRLTARPLVEKMGPVSVHRPLPRRGSWKPPRTPVISPGLVLRLLNGLSNSKHRCLPNEAQTAKPLGESSSKSGRCSITRSRLSPKAPNALFLLRRNSQAGAQSPFKGRLPVLNHYLEDFAREYNCLL